MSKRRLGPSPSERRQAMERDMAAATAVMERTIRDQVPDMPGRNALMLCARVGSVDFLPAGERYELISCEMCGASLWVTSRLKEATEAKGMTVKAICYSGCDWRPS